MKVFISWSGRLSQEVALALRDWLPAVIQSIEPYVSSEDIEKGARWGSEISKELEASDFGILCITPTNIGAPWLNFEAGALSKAIDRSRVVPFLFRLDRAELPQGPLVQFQSVIADKDEVRKMVFALNASCGDRALEESRLEGFFDYWWPKLVEALDGISVEDDAPADLRRTDQDLLAEVLEIVRGQQQILNSPESLLPPAYVNDVLRRGRRFPEDISPVAARDLLRAWAELLDALEAEPASPAVQEAVESMVRPIEHMFRRIGTRGPKYRRQEPLELAPDIGKSIGPSDASET